MIVGLLLSVLFAQGSLAQAPSADPVGHEIRPSGAAYLDSIRFRGIDGDVAYYDPAGATPPLDAAPPPPEAPEAGEAPPWQRLLLLLFTGAILAGFAYALLRHGGFAGGAFGRGDGGNAARVRASTATFEEEAAPDLAAITALADPRAALIELTRLALMRAGAAHGLLLNRSWTARDVLRRLPADWAHLPALRALVREAELVHFGGRPIARETVVDHLAALSPLFTERPA